MNTADRNNEAQQMAWKRSLKRILILLAFIYASILVLFYFFQDKLLYFPQPPDTVTAGHETLRKHQKTLVMEDGTKLSGWIHDKKADCTVVYFGGNAEEVSGTYYNLDVTGCNIVLFNYRGYGESEGKPSNNKILSDAASIIQEAVQLAPQATLYLVGWSLGSGVASMSCAHHKVEKIFLLTPYDDVKEVAKRYFPYLPAFIMHEGFSNLAGLAHCPAEPFIFIAEGDRVIPNRYTENLIAQRGIAPENVFRIDHTTHNELCDDSRVWKTIAAKIQGN